MLILLEILVLWVCLRVHSKMNDLPMIGQFYDLVKLITTKLEHPFEDAQKSFAHTADLDTALSVEEIQGVLFESKRLSDIKVQRELRKKPKAPSQALESASVQDNAQSSVVVSEFSSSVKPQSVFSEVFVSFKSALDAVLDSKSEAEKTRCVSYVNRFFDCVHLYVESFSKVGYSVLLYALLSYIKNSQTSSIAQRDLSTELSEYRNSFDILSRVPLVEHMLDVVEMISRQISQTPGLTSMHEGLLVVGVYHDIGKIEDLINQHIAEKEAYSMIDHALISAEFLRKRYLSLNEDVPAEYIEAIQFHHKPESDVPKTNAYFKSLKTADHKARESEILSNIDKLPSITQLIDRSALIDIILQMFNIDYSNRVSIPDIFCLKGYMFVHEMKLKDNIAKYLSRNKKLCKEQKLSDSTYLGAVKSMLEAYSIVSTERHDKYPVLVFKSTSTRVRNERRLRNFIAISLEVFNSVTSAFPQAPQELSTAEAVEFKKYFEA